MVSGFWLQGVLGLMSGILGRCFFRRCYQLFGEALDILALLNGAINFILYCAMSRQYRQTFRQLFSVWPHRPRPRPAARPAAALATVSAPKRCVASCAANSNLPMKKVSHKKKHKKTARVQGTSRLEATASGLTYMSPFQGVRDTEGV